MHSLTTPEQIGRYRALVVLKAIELYLKADGKMMLTRTATPQNMRMIASEYTGKVYPRSRKGLEAAHRDLKALLSSI